jgi:hypothetical protein
MRNMHRGFIGSVVDLVPLHCIDLNRSESFMRAISNAVPNVAAFVARDCPLTGFANHFLGVVHQP